MTEGNFVDYVKINVFSGNGGKGSAHFRREKYITKGGPDGGDGGRGGHVIFVTDKSLWTLHHFRFQKHFKCGHGGDGSGSRSTGADGSDSLIRVPVGTVIRDTETNNIIYETIGCLKRYYSLLHQRVWRAGARAGYRENLSKDSNQTCAC